jgi:hypothetical protein
VTLIEALTVWRIPGRGRPAVRNVISYILAAALVVVLTDIIASPAGFDLAAGAWSSVGGNASSQIVDRSHKGDRLQFPTAKHERNTPSRHPAMLIGCEPVFSALSSGARANFAGRCVA